MKYFVSLCVLFPLVMQYSSAFVVPDRRLLARVEIAAPVEERPVDRRSITAGPEVDEAGAGLLSPRANLAGHSKRLLGMGPKLSGFVIPAGLTTSFLTFTSIFHRGVEQGRKLGKSITGL